MAISPVPFQEHEDSPIEGGGRDGSFNFTRIFLTAWADRMPFVRSLFTDGLFGPQGYSPDWPGVMADKFRIERIVNKPTSATPVMTNPETQMINHNCLAKITVDYSPIQPIEAEDRADLPDGTWATYSMSDALEFIGLPGRTMKWQTSGDLLPPDVTPVAISIVTRHEVTWHEVQNPPWGLISKMKGKVNSLEMRIPGTRQFAAPETLMLTACQSKRSFKLSGATAWELTLSFSEKAQKAIAAPGTRKGAINNTAGTVYGWNHQYDPAQEAYDRPVNSAGELMFDKDDLYSIFRP